jgi:hypothetical protein
MLLGVMDGWLLMGSVRKNCQQESTPWTQVSICISSTPGIPSSITRWRSCQTAAAQQRAKLGSTPLKAFAFWAIVSHIEADMVDRLHNESFRHLELGPGQTSSRSFLLTFSKTCQIMGKSKFLEKLPFHDILSLQIMWGSLSISNLFLRIDIEWRYKKERCQ